MKLSLVLLVLLAPISCLSAMHLPGRIERYETNTFISYCKIHQGNMILEANYYKNIEDYTARTFSPTGDTEHLLDEAQRIFNMLQSVYARQ